MGGITQLIQNHAPETAPPETVPETQPAVERRRKPRTRGAEDSFTPSTETENGIDAVHTATLGAKADTPAERDLAWRRSILPEHSRWHGLQAVGRTTDKDFFEFHRDLLGRFNRQRRDNGLPALEAWNPGAVPGPGGRMLQPPNPNDFPNFHDFSRAMIQYHNAAHNSTAGSAQDISDPGDAPMQNRFWQFHTWVDQQYQAWINRFGQPPND